MVGGEGRLNVSYNHLLSNINGLPGELHAPRAVTKKIDVNSLRSTDMGLRVAFGLVILRRLSVKNCKGRRVRKLRDCQLQDGNLDM